jgi:hypothetical protein
VLVEAREGAELEEFAHERAEALHVEVIDSFGRYARNARVLREELGHAVEIGRTALLEADHPVEFLYQLVELDELFTSFGVRECGQRDLLK